MPVTSSAERVYAFQVLLPAEETGLRLDSKGQAEQARAVALERIGPIVGHVPLRLMREVDDALRLHLQL